jgi:WD40 repeat protein
MSFPSSIFDSNPKVVSSLEKEYRILKELQQQKSECLQKLVELDKRIDAQIDKIGKWVEEEDDVVIVGSSQRTGDAVFRNFDTSKTSLPQPSPLEKIMDRSGFTSISGSHQPSPIRQHSLSDKEFDAPPKRTRVEVGPCQLQSLKQYIIGRTERKSRSLLLPQHNSTTAISTSLDGKLHLWNTKTEQRIRTISRESWMADKGWCEDIKWLGTDIVVLAHSSGPTQLSLLKPSTENTTPLRNAHSKNVNVVTSISDKQFISAGLDKKLVLWDLNNDEEKPTRIHESHSSKILDLCVFNSEKRLYSGGQDSRLICADLETKTILHGLERLSGAVRDVLHIPNTNSLMTL